VRLLVLDNLGTKRHLGARSSSNTALRLLPTIMPPAPGSRSNPGCARMMDVVANISAYRPGYRGSQATKAARWHAVNPVDENGVGTSPCCFVVYFLNMLYWRFGDASACE
jgi:hypothetical protein